MDTPLTGKLVCCELTTVSKLYIHVDPYNFSVQAGRWLGSCGEVTSDSQNEPQMVALLALLAHHCWDGLECFCMHC